MKKVYLLFCLFTGVICFSHAQNDPSAKAILDKVSAKLQSVKGASAKFTYSTKNKNNVTQGSVLGNILLKGNKYYIKQGSTEIISDGAKTWNFNGDNEVTVSDVDADSKSLSPQKLLSGSFYDKDFSYKLISNKGNLSEIELVPTDKRKNFTKVNVFVDKSKNLITKANILDKNGNTVQFTLSNINTNAAIPDSKFQFDAKKHPGVEVISE
ncbi:MAG: outer membrane lipoprotein carrier protein LolA [Chitinophagaceae bacterium]|jgi:outer membrane lipoprotein-sorting protein|nr:outer membrane lipoprotein carrier protein LolA [Chitinophagaceae bacterium]